MRFGIFSLVALAALVPLAAHAMENDPAARGRLFVEEHCARCHSIEAAGASPYPGAQPFRNLLARWAPNDLATALRQGITARHDEAEIAPPIMQMTDDQFDDFLAFVKTIQPADDLPTRP